MNTITINKGTQAEITAGPFVKMDLPIGALYRIVIRNDYGDDERYDADILLDRQEMLALGYAFLSMCGMQV